MTTTQVLIVGAGPTGLTLGCELARRDIDCLVVDKAPRLFPGSRGKGLQPRTLEVFDDLGVLDAVLAAGAPFPSFRMYQGTHVQWTRTLHDMLGIAPVERVHGVPYPDAWLLPQWRTDELLRDRLLELGGRIEMGTELVDFVQDDTGVTATLSRNGTLDRVHARYLVGADGGGSFVRKALGVGFEGETFETERTLIGDVRAEGLTGTYCHVLTTGDVQERFSLWSMPGTDYYQFVASMTADEVPELTVAAVQKILDERSGRSDIRLFDLNWISVYRVNVRMVDRFRVDRVFLAGDAAHVHSSAGGQGLNTSIQDAYNLGWKLAAVLSGVPDGLLDTYEDERFPIAAQVLDVTTHSHRRNFRAPEPGQGSPDIFQLKLNYRGGPLAVDMRENPGAVRAGDRAPDAQCAEGRLFDLFRGPHFTLLGFGADTASSVAEVVRGQGDRVRARVIEPGIATDATFAVGAAFRNYDIDPAGPGALVLVRPDGYIGVVATDPAPIQNYLIW
ncbi:FAD-dependent monooxygenase [Nocardia suismassiliense]|uniref:FAD-dependent monooxygenase n=1 Tax=Nocardia suismassiliense TaxID=2077092 RepID=UPI000D1EBA61|nr:FAD-dependent monooxygenase [Nocardia suismassiliense]